MNAIEIEDTDATSLIDLLKLAQQGNIIIKTSKGKLFILAQISEDIEDFDKEVELHRSSKELMDILNERSKNKGTKTSISEMRKEFGLEEQSNQRPQS